jgi:hypothetical protein
MSTTARIAISATPTAKGADKEKGLFALALFGAPQMIGKDERRKETIEGNPAAAVWRNCSEHE